MGFLGGALGSLVGNVIGSAIKSKGERRAAEIQAKAADAAMEEMRGALTANEQRQLEAQRTNRDFQLNQMDWNKGYQLNNLNKFTGQVNGQQDYMQSLFNPYAQGGLGAYQAQQNLLGLGGNDAQSAAISQVNNSPYMQELMKQGESSILQNASATGGLRGGNTQGALAQFRPGMLNQLIQQQYANLGGLSGMGFNASSLLGQSSQQATSQLGEMQQHVADQLGNYGLNVANNLGAYGQNTANQIGQMGLQGSGAIADLMTGKGAAQAGGKLSQYGFWAGLPGQISGAMGQAAGLAGGVPAPGGGMMSPASPGVVPQSWGRMYGGGKSL